MGAIGGEVREPDRSFPADQHGRFGSPSRGSGTRDAPITQRSHQWCRCWNTTTRELQSCLGMAVEHLDLGQLHLFVRAWHEVHEQYGPDRRAETNAVLAGAVKDLLGEGSARLTDGGAEAPVGTRPMAVPLAEVR